MEAGDTIAVSSDEVIFLRTFAQVPIEEESPFFGLETEVDVARAVDTLAERNLADVRTQRPNRELIRRLLIVSQPDSRIALLRAGAGQGERLIDLYQRAGAFVRYSRHLDEHRFGPVLEFIDVVDEIASRFRPRRSTGDFVQFRLNAPEHFAFSILTAEYVARMREGRADSRVGLAVPPRNDSLLLDPSMDGAVLLPGRRVENPRVARRASPTPSVPSEGAWRGALEGLVAKNVAQASGGMYEIRPYLHDLAIGIAAQNRHVLTRFDFGGEEWVVRDATIVPVTASLFLLRPLLDGGLFVRELDGEALKKAVRHAIEDVHDGTTVDL